MLDVPWGNTDPHCPLNSWLGTTAGSLGLFTGKPVMSDFGLSSWAEHYFLAQNLLPSCLRGSCRAASTLRGGWRRQNRDQFSACTLAWCGQYVHTWALCPPIQGMLCSIYLYYKYPLPFVRVEESVCHEREWDLRFNCFVSRFNPPSGFWLHLQSTCRKT